MPTVIAHAYPASCIARCTHHFSPLPQKLAAASVTFSRQKGRQTPETRYQRVQAGPEMVLGGTIRRRSRWSR